MSEDKEYKDEDYRIVEDERPSVFSKPKGIVITVPIPRAWKRSGTTGRWNRCGNNRYDRYADFIEGICDEQDDES